MNVAILGASDNPERYAHKALKMLLEHGHRPLPVNPRLQDIEGIPVVAALANLKEPIDTITMYLSPSLSTTLDTAILAAKPRRVIFNPGAENMELQDKLSAQGIAVIQACTLVLLRTGQF